MAFLKEPSGGVGFTWEVYSTQTPGAGDPRALAPTPWPAVELMKPDSPVCTAHSGPFQLFVCSRALVFHCRLPPCLSGADAVPDNEQYISAGGVGEGAGRGERPS